MNEIIYKKHYIKFNGGNWYGWKTHDTMEIKFLTTKECVTNVLRLLKMVQQCQLKLMLMQRYKN